MNVPNLLSLFRILITFFFILAVYHDRFDYALYLFILQGVTDLLDGYIARVMSKKTNLGAYLDPIADKTMLLAAFVMLSIKGIVPRMAPDAYYPEGPCRSRWFFYPLQTWPIQSNRSRPYSARSRQPARSSQSSSSSLSIFSPGRMRASIAPPSFL